MRILNAIQYRFKRVILDLHLCADVGKWIIQRPRGAEAGHVTRTSTFHTFFQLTSTSWRTLGYCRNVIYRQYMSKIYFGRLIKAVDQK